MDEAVIPEGSVYISARHVPFVWPMVRQYVEDFLIHLNGEYEVDDIRDELLRGNMQLFLAWQGHVKGMVITQISQYPRKRALRVFILCGSDFDSWMNSMQAKLLQFQAHMGCDYMETICRPGLQKMVKHLGWEVKQILMTHRSN